MIERKGLRIAFTGRRNVGKSTAVHHLEKQGFVQIHAFTAGKMASVVVFDHILEQTKYTGKGYRMCFGDLKDVPCPALPGGVAPRKFLEDFGKFMGVGLGVEWTLKAEVERAERIYGKDVNLAVDSMIYESDYWRDIGGLIVRLERPEFEGQPVVESDVAQAAVKHDFVAVASSPEEVEENITSIVQFVLTNDAAKN